LRGRARQRQWRSEANGFEMRNNACNMNYFHVDLRHDGWEAWHDKDGGELKKTGLVWRSGTVFATLIFIRIDLRHDSCEAGHDKGGGEGVEGQARVEGQHGLGHPHYGKAEMVK